MRKLTENDCIYALRKLNGSARYVRYHANHSQAYFTPRVVRDFLYDKSCYDCPGDEQRQIGEVGAKLESIVEEGLASKVVVVVSISSSISSDVRVGYKLTKKGKEAASKILLSKKSLKELKEKASAHLYPPA